MPRRNRNAARSRLARRSQDNGGGVLVVSDGLCTLPVRRPKVRFATRARAAEALREAQKTRAAKGSTDHVETRYYACPEGGCGGYHLTSRSAEDERAWREKQEGTA